MKKTKTFPQVWKNKNGCLTIIYRDRVEIYRLETKETKTWIDEHNGDASYDYEDIFGKGWNAYHESDLMKGNGFRQVKDESEVEE